MAEMKFVKLFIAGVGCGIGYALATILAEKGIDYIRSRRMFSLDTDDDWDEDKNADVEEFGDDGCFSCDEADCHLCELKKKFAEAKDYAPDSFGADFPGFIEGSPIFQAGYRKGMKDNEAVNQILREVPEGDGFGEFGAPLSDGDFEEDDSDLAAEEFFDSEADTDDEVEDFSAFDDEEDFDSEEEWTFDDDEEDMDSEEEIDDMEFKDSEEEGTFGADDEDMDFDSYSDEEDADGDFTFSKDEDADDYDMDADGYSLEGKDNGGDGGSSASGEDDEF